MVTGVNCKHQSDCQSGHKPSNIYHITTNMKLVSNIHVYLSIKHLVYKLSMKDYRWTKLKPSKMLFYLFLLVIINSNDIQTNPGPSNDSTRYLCGTCDPPVNWDHKGVVCETCD